MLFNTDVASSFITNGDEVPSSIPNGSLSINWKFRGSWKPLICDEYKRENALGLRDPCLGKKTPLVKLNWVLKL